MPPADFTRRLATYVAWTAGILFIPAAISAVFAAWSAVTDGQIILYSVGKTATSREAVPWQHGWARLASPLVLLLAALAYPRDENPATARLLLFVLLGAAGSAMLVFSLWFKTLTGAVALLALLAYIALAHFVDARFGRKAAFLLLIGTVFLALYAYAAA
jgi:hypothetical protein